MKEARKDFEMTKKILDESLIVFDPVDCLPLPYDDVAVILREGGKPEQAHLKEDREHWHVTKDFGSSFSVFELETKDIMYWFRK